MGTFVTASPHVPLPANKTDANPPTGATYEIDAVDLNGPQGACNDLYIHTQGYATPYDYGAKGDGVTDDSGAVQSAIDANKGGVVILPAGTFLCAGLLLADSTYNKTAILSTGGILKLKPDGGLNNFQAAAWTGLVVGTADAVTLDLIWDGNRAAMTANEHVYCVGVAGSTNLNIRRLVVREIRGDGLYIGQSTWTVSGTDATDIHVGNLIASNSADDGRNALTIISGQRIQIDSIESLQVGGLIGATTEPGGVDIEPDHGYQAVSHVTIGSANIVSAGTSGFQILGQSVGGADAHDWNVSHVRVDNLLVKRTGTSGSGLAAANIIRCKNVTINGDIYYATTPGAGWQLDFADYVRGSLGANNVTTGVRVAPVGALTDSEMRINVTGYTQFGIRACLTTRCRFTGRVGAAVAGSADAIATHNEGRGTITQANTVYSIDAPYDGAASHGFSNVTGNTVSYSNCFIQDCDISGYAGFSTAVEATTCPTRVNVRGINEASAMPANGTWNRGEFVRNSSPSMQNGGTSLLGWVRLTTGTGNVLYGAGGTNDWANAWVEQSTASGGLTPTNGGVVGPDASLARQYLVTIGSGVASYTITSPLHPIVAQVIEFTILNNTGGSISSPITQWDAVGTSPSLGFVLAGGTWTDPAANTKERSVAFRYDSSTGKWREIWRTSGDA